MHLTFVLLRHLFLLLPPALITYEVIILFGIPAYLEAAFFRLRFFQQQL